MASSGKIKILLVGSVQGHFSVLVKKLVSLQASKAGPFDVCFCVGPITVPDDHSSEGGDLPIPVYLQEYTGGIKSKNEKEEEDSSILSLGNNLFYLQGSNNNDDSWQRFEIPLQSQILVVGSCSRRVRVQQSTTTTTTTTRQQEQVDLLLSSDWPQGMEDVVNVDTEPLSFDVAEVALTLRPRYHVAPSTQQYHASPPYDLPNSDHVGRFLALAPVIPGKATKTTKFIHALGLIPLSAHPPPTTAPSTLPCPFLSQQLETSSSTVTSSGGNVPGFAIRQGNHQASGYSRFAATNQKRRRDDGDNNNNNDPISLEPPEDPTINTLFLYGLHKDVTGELQSTSSPKVLQAFSKFGVVRVRHPPNTKTTTYCFLEFPDQQKALECLLDCQGRIVIDAVELTLKWATQQSGGNKKRSRYEQQPERHYVTHSEAADSTSLYFHPPQSSNQAKNGNGNNDNSNNRSVCKTPEELSAFAESLCQYLQKTLEDALNEGNDDGERVTAETEPALAVTVRTKDSFGFCEFASHAAATMALAAVTTSTDGGLIVEEPTDGSKPPSSLVGTTLRWAKGVPKSKSSGRDQVLEALGLQRQFYPADTRTDCWFCLASPTCETHLIAGVYNEWYLTLPKGPIHPGHVLLVPVTHTPQGAWTLGQAEWTQLVDKLQAHASKTYDYDLLVFERAMETKGGYHTHVNCVPIPRDCTTKLQATMMAHAKASGFDLRNIQSDLTMASMISTEDSYFYAEIRTPSQTHRFLHKQDQEEKSLVPLQFAREVLASVLQNPKLAHWKSCVVDKDEETKMAASFRDSFAAVSF